MRCWALVAFLFALFSGVLAHRIEVEPNSKQCFFETLNVEDQVGSRGHG